jgi:hypothetical protein
MSISFFGVTQGAQKLPIEREHAQTSSNLVYYNYLIYLRQMRSPSFTVDRSYLTENHGVGGSIPPLGTIPSPRNPTINHYKSIS